MAKGRSRARTHDFFGGKQGGDHAEGAVVTSCIDHGIDMRAAIKRRRPLGPEATDHVSGGIDGGARTGLLHPAPDQIRRPAMRRREIESGKIVGRIADPGEFGQHGGGGGGKIIKATGEHGHQITPLMDSRNRTARTPRARRTDGAFTSTRRGSCQAARTPSGEVAHGTFHHARQEPRDGRKKTRREA